MKIQHVKLADALAAITKRRIDFSTVKKPKDAKPLSKKLFAIFAAAGIPDNSRHYNRTKATA